MEAVYPDDIAVVKISSFTSRRGWLLTLIPFTHRVKGKGNHINV